MAVCGAPIERVPRPACGTRIAGLLASQRIVLTGAGDFLDLGAVLVDTLGHGACHVDLVFRGADVRDTGVRPPYSCIHSCG